MRSLKIFQILFVAVLVSLIVKTFLFDAFVVKGDSMSPNFRDGDYLFLDKISYYFYKPSRGEVAVVKSRDINQNILKRVVGLPGERIEIKNGTVVVKDSRSSPDKILEETYLPSGAVTPLDTIITLDDREYFLMGDNRFSSEDSRTTGPFSLSRFKGRALFSARFNSSSLLPQINFIFK